MRPRTTAALAALALGAMVSDPMGRAFDNSINAYRGRREREKPFVPVTLKPETKKQNKRDRMNAMKVKRKRNRK